MPFYFERVPGVHITIPGDCMDALIDKHLLRIASDLYVDTDYNGKYVVCVADVIKETVVTNGDQLADKAHILEAGCGIDYEVTLILISVSIHKNETVQCKVTEVTDFGVFATYGTVSMFCSHRAFSGDCADMVFSDQGGPRFLKEGYPPVVKGSIVFATVLNTASKAATLTQAIVASLVGFCE
jgi:hypothetical protein